MNTHSHVILVFLLVCGVMVLPVCASSIVTTGYFDDSVKEIELDNLYNFTYSVNSTRAISNIQFKAPKGTELNYTITYGAGNSLDGYITYLPGDIDIFGYGQGVTTINIGGSTAYREYIDTGLIPKWEIVGYAQEREDNGTISSQGYCIYDIAVGLGVIGIHGGFIAYEPVANIQPIESITFTANKPVWMEIKTASRTGIRDTLQKSAIDQGWEWVNLAMSIGGSVLGFVLMLLGFIKFFFIDNLLMVMALWIGVTMAVSALTTRNIFQFYHKFFRYQRALLDFIVQLWNYLIQIIAAFRGIFRII